MKKIMKITFVLPGWTTLPGGGFKVIYEYANRLSKRGHIINLVHPLDLDACHGLIWRNYVKCRRYTGSILRGNWFKLNPAINFIVTPTPEERYIPNADFIIATAWKTAGWVNGYPSSKGEKYYFIQSYETWCGDKPSVDRTWTLKLKKITISRWLQTLAKEFGESAIWIPNAVDHGIFNIVKPIEERDPFSIGMVYHNGTWKGFSDGLKAVSIANAKFPKISLKLFGIFPKPKKMPRWVAYTKNPSLRELVCLYNDMSIFVHSSVIEGWGLPPAEAMACGCAVAATNSQGILDYAEHNKNALISPIQSPERLAENIITLIGNNVRRIELAQAGNKDIKQFSWERSVNCLQQALTGENDDIA